MVPPTHQRLYMYFLEDRGGERERERERDRDRLRGLPLGLRGSMFAGWLQVVA